MHIQPDRSAHHQPPARHGRHEEAAAKNDTHGFALAPHPGESQGRPVTPRGSQPIRTPRPARPRSPRAPVPERRRRYARPRTNPATPLPILMPVHHSPGLDSGRSHGRPRTTPGSQPRRLPAACPTRTSPEQPWPAISDAPRATGRLRHSSFIPRQRHRPDRAGVPRPPRRASHQPRPRRLPRLRQPGLHRELVLETEAALHLARGVRDPRAGASRPRPARPRGMAIRRDQGTTRSLRRRTCAARSP